MGNPNLVGGPGEDLGPDLEASAPDRQEETAKSAVTQKVPKKRTKTGCLSTFNCGDELCSTEPKHPLTKCFKTIQPVVSDASNAGKRNPSAATVLNPSVSVKVMLSV